jgi:hypothetical protein
MSAKRAVAVPKAKFARLALTPGLLLVACLTAVAQSYPLPRTPIPATAAEAPSRLVLEDGTPVKLRTGRTISSADARVGDLVDLEVTHDVSVSRIMVIPRGSVAWGTVVEVHRKRRLGRGGKLNIRLDSVRLINGEKAALRSMKQVRGGGHTTAMTAGMAVTALAFYPAAPALLFMKGQDSTILKGTEVTAYIDGNFALEAAKLSQSASPVHKAIVPVSDSATRITPNKKLLSEIIELLPRRVLDSQGNEGDMVNLVFLASQEKLEQAFEQAGWVETIRSKKRAIWHAARKPKNNVLMPMSNLFVFGRSQDYGYAMGDPVSRATRRHHLRIWKTDYEVGGYPVWVGAATHDIGLERDKRKWAITHKIAPDVDGERDFIGGSLIGTHLVINIQYVLPSSDAIVEAVTATGRTYHSDGRMLLLGLQ